MVTQPRRICLSTATTSGKPIYKMVAPIRNPNTLINPILTRRRFSHCKKMTLTLCSLFSKTYDSFSMNDSSFLIHKVKESTGRVVMFKEFNIMNSYTLECSLCGPSIGLRKDYHYTKKMLFVTCNQANHLGHGETILYGSSWHQWLSKVQDDIKRALVQILIGLLDRTDQSESAIFYSWAYWQ